MIPNYEKMLESFYRSFLKQGDVVVDIGAHVGRHTLPCAELIGKNGQVFSFEPLPTQFRILSDLVSQRTHRDGSSAICGINLHNCALGEEEGETEFVVVSEFPEYSGFKERIYHIDNPKKEFIKVNVRTLDSFGIKNVRYIKVDAEGGELIILRGGIKTILDSRPIVSFELGNASLINYNYTAHDYFDFFHEKGYQIYSIFGFKINRDDFIACVEKQFFWDYIAIPDQQEWPAGAATVRVLVEQLSSVSPNQDYVIANQPLQDTKQQLQDTKQQLQDTKQQLQEVLSSNSWRLTSPLRSLKKYL